MAGASFSDEVQANDILKAENEKLTEIFIDNLQRYIEGRPFRNLLDKKALY